MEHLTKRFIKKNVFGAVVSSVSAADDVSFCLDKGEVLVLAGESGSGKSTIAKMILGSISPDSGNILFEGHPLDGGRKSMHTIRMNCQMIHQDPYDSINPRMTVGSIIAEPLEIHKIGNNKADRVTRVKEVLAEVRLEPVDEIVQKRPHLLSGGQRQRVVLARAMALRPKIILADEPVSMLDVSIRAEILDLMRELQQKHKMSFIYITHDLATARHFGQRVCILYRGKIVEMGSMDDVLFSPLHPYTQALIDAIPYPDPDNVHKDKMIRIRDDAHIRTSTAGRCRFLERCPYSIDACNVEPPLDQIIQKDHLAACRVDIKDNKNVSNL